MIIVVSVLLGVLAFVFAIVNLIFAILDLFAIINNSKDKVKLRVFCILQIVLSSLFILGSLFLVILSLFN